MLDCGLKVNCPLEIRPGELRCPRCFRKDVAPSMQRGMVDALMRWRGRIPRHCRSCGKRFYVREAELLGTAQPAETAAE